jgi:hypothetical protein
VKIALLRLAFGGSERSATGVRGRALEQYLRGRGHSVETLSPRQEVLTRNQWWRESPLARLLLRVVPIALPSLWDAIADDLEPRLLAGGHDAALAIGQDCGQVLVRGSFRGRKLLDMHNVLFLEAYHSGSASLPEIEALFERELRVLQAVDHLLVPHHLLAGYFLDRVGRERGLGPKVTVVRLGCDLAARRAVFADPPQLVYTGSAYPIQDPYLLSCLAQRSPLPLHCYGPTDPNRRFFPARLDYRGYAASLDVLADHQIGLVTVSRDALRQHSPSSKFAPYFAHGLPVLFPSWMKEGHEYGEAALAYEEDSFAQRCRELSVQQAWERRSAAALALAETLAHDVVMEPLGRLLG